MLQSRERKNVKVLRKHVASVNLICNIPADSSDVMEQVIKFTAKCYGQPMAKCTSEARINMQIVQIGKTEVTCVPKLASLPQTTEAFMENVKRAHLQTFLWKNALLLDLTPQTMGG